MKNYIAASVFAAVLFSGANSIAGTPAAPYDNSRIDARLTPNSSASSPSEGTFCPGFQVRSRIICFICSQIWSLMVVL